MAWLKDMMDLFFGKLMKGKAQAPCPAVGTIPWFRARFRHLAVHNDLFLARVCV